MLRGKTGWLTRLEVRKNLRLVNLSHLSGTDRDAARRVFSILAHFETIAVVSCERHEFVTNQLFDEYCHHQTFVAIADSLGGLEPPFPELQELLDFMSMCTEHDSLLVVNRVGEPWLASVFECVARLENLAPELFRKIGQEERRHVYGAETIAPPSPQDVVGPLRQLESLLYRVASSEWFTLPLLQISDRKFMANIGLMNAIQHKKSCKHLGVLPGPRVRDLVKSCRAARMNPGARQVEKTTWQITANNAWKEPAMMPDTGIYIDFPYDLRELESRFATAVGRILERRPEWNRTCIAGRIFEPERVVVGFRREYDPGQPIAVHLTDPHKKSLKTIRTQVKARFEKLRRKPRRAVPDLSPVVSMMPGADCAVTISNVYVHNVRQGWGPTHPWEQATWHLYLCHPQNFEGMVRVVLLSDHRVFAGSDLGQFGDELCREFETHQKWITKGDSKCA